MTALLTLADAAERLAVSSASVRRLIQADHLAEHAERISAVSEVKPLLRRVV